MLKNTLQKKKKKSIKKKFNYESKYNAQVLYNKKNSLLKQKVKS